MLAFFWALRCTSPHRELAVNMATTCCLPACRRRRSTRGRPRRPRSRHSPVRNTGMDTKKPPTAHTLVVDDLRRYLSVLETKGVGLGQEAIHAHLGQGNRIGGWPAQGPKAGPRLACCSLVVPYEPWPFRAKRTGGCFGGCLGGCPTRQRHIKRNASTTLCTAHRGISAENCGQ